MDAKTIKKIYTLSAIAQHQNDGKMAEKIDTIMDFVGVVQQIDVPDGDGCVSLVPARVPYATSPDDFDFSANIPHERVDNHLVIASPIKR